MLTNRPRNSQVLQSTSSAIKMFLEYSGSDDRSRSYAMLRYGERDLQTPFGYSFHTYYNYIPYHKGASYPENDSGQEFFKKLAEHELRLRLLQIRMDPLEYSQWLEEGNKRREKRQNTELSILM